MISTQFMFRSNVHELQACSCTVEMLRHLVSDNDDNNNKNNKDNTTPTRQSKYQKWKRSKTISTYDDDSCVGAMEMAVGQWFSSERVKQRR